MFIVRIGLSVVILIFMWLGYDWAIKVMITLLYFISEAIIHNW